MLQRQFDPVADQRLPRQQLILRRAEGPPEGMDQPYPRRIAPDQHGRARHQIGIHPLGHHHAPIGPRGLFHHPLEPLETQPLIPQRMGQIEDRVILRLPVDAVQHHPPRGGQPVEHHFPRQPHRRQLRRIAEQHQRREDLAQVLQRPLVQHRGFVDEPHIQRLLPPLPSLDEVRTFQSRRRQGPRNRRHLLEKGECPVQRKVRQPLHNGPLPLPGQPFGDAFIFRVIDGGVKDAVDRRRRHPPQAQHARRLVRRRKDGQRAAILPPPPLVIARDDLHPCRQHRLGQPREQHRLARSGLPHHRQNRGLPLCPRRDLPRRQVDAIGIKLRQNAVEGFRLIV